MKYRTHIHILHPLSSKISFNVCSPHFLFIALSNPADNPQLLIFWRTVQRDSQSALVTGTSRFVAPWHNIRSKSDLNWSKSYSPVIFGCLWHRWRHWCQATVL